VNKYFFVLPFALPSLFIAVPSFASHAEQINSTIYNLHEIELPVTKAQLLTQESLPSQINLDIQPEKQSMADKNADIVIEVSADQDPLPQSTPIHVIDQEEIQK
jgi:hypothetical protein